MLKQTLLVLGILLLIVSITGCLPKKDIVIPPTNIYCNPPLRPVLLILDKNNYICTKENIQTILTDLNYLTDYGLKMEATIKCYEDAQKAPPKEK